MTGIFQSKNPLSTPILFVYGLLLKFPYIFVHPQIIRNQSDGFLFNYLADAVESNFQEWPFLLGMIIYLLLFFQAIIINYFINNYRMMEKTNFLPAMTFLLVGSFFPEWNGLSSALIVNVFVVWILGRILVLVRAKNAKPTLFNVGFVIGISAFFYFPSLAVALLIIFCLIVARPPHAAEWAILFLGILVPWYLLYSILFLSDRLSGFSFPLFDFAIPDIRLSIELLVFLGLLFICVLWGIVLEQLGHLKHMIQVRRSWLIILMGIVTLILIPLLSVNENLSNWLTCLVFISPVIAYGFFYTSYKRLVAILHWVMVGFIIYFQYFN